MVVYLVQGATGNTGFATAKELLKRKSEQDVVRAGVRDTKNHKAEILKKLGAEIVELDTTKPKFKKAFKGVDKLFICPPNSEDRADITKTLVEAAKEVGVKYIVDISVLGAEYESILFAKQLRQSEKNVEASGIDWTHLRPIFFQENLFGWAPEIKQGFFYFAIKNGGVPMISVEDIGECAAIILASTDGSHKGKSYNLTGPKLVGGSKIAKTFSKYLKQVVSFYSPSEEDTKKALEKMGVQPWQIKGYLELFNLFASKQAETVFDDVKKLTGRRARSFKRFVKANRSAFQPDATPVILVQGATGNTGRATVLELLKHKDYIIRAGVRDLFSEKAEELRKLGAQVVFLDSSKSKSLDQALEGVHRFLIVPPNDEHRADITKTLVKAAKKAQVKHIVDISVLGAEYESILFAKQLRQSERNVEASGIDWTHLRPTFFQENFLQYAEGIKQGTLYLPIKEGKLPIVSCKDIGRCAAIALIKDGHKNKSYNITGPESLSGAQIAEIFSKELGRKIEYVSPSQEETKKSLEKLGVKPWQIKGYLELFDLISENRVADVADGVSKLTNKKAHSFGYFVRRNVSAFLPENFPVIVVQGATGNTGGATVRALLETKKCLVRAGVRDLNSPKTEELRKLGARVVVMDTEKPQTLRKALAGAHKLVIVPPNLENRADITKTLARAAKVAGVKHIVDISVLGAEYESILFGRQLRQSEKNVEATGVNWTHIRPIFFQENFFGWADGIKNGGIYMPIKDGKIPVISVNDIGQCTSAVLLGSGHESKSYNLTGPQALSGEEMAKIFSEVVGHQVQFFSPTHEETKQSLEKMGVQSWQIEGYLELFDLFASKQAETVFDNVKQLTGKDPTPLVEFVEANRSAFSKST